MDKKNKTPAEGREQNPTPQISMLRSATELLLTKGLILLPRANRLALQHCNLGAPRFMPHGRGLIPSSTYGGIDWINRIHGIDKIDRIDSRMDWIGRIDTIHRIDAIHRIRKKDSVGRIDRVDRID